MHLIEIEKGPVSIRLSASSDSPENHPVFALRNSVDKESPKEQLVTEKQEQQEGVVDLHFEPGVEFTEPLKKKPPLISNALLSNKSQFSAEWVEQQVRTF